MDPYTDEDDLVHTGTGKSCSSQKFTDKHAGTEATVFNTGTVKYCWGIEESPIH